MKIPLLFYRMAIRSAMRLNWPNKITLIRILFIPLFMFFLLLPNQWGAVVAMAIFAIAALSDAVDGYIARSYNQETTFGKFADPLADKLLITAALLSFVQLDKLGAVTAMVIISREFLVTGLRILAISQDEVIPASVLGKIKTLSHIGLVFVILGNEYWNWGAIGATIQVAFVWSAISLALLSAADYFYKSRKLFKKVA